MLWNYPPALDENLVWVRQVLPMLPSTIQLCIVNGAKPIPPQWALIDSRATNNFIDAEAAQALQIPLHLKPTSVLIETTDESLLSLGPVVQETVSLEAILQGHRQVLQFSVIHFRCFPLILGVTWREQHNPCISW